MTSTLFDLERPDAGDVPGAPRRAGGILGEIAPGHVSPVVGDVPE